ncbi:MAG: hypothetical protein AB1746_09915 [Candidatus Zixiibacteriota bacterium]
MNTKPRYLFIILLIIIAGLFWAGCGGDDDNAVNSDNHAPVILSMSADPDTMASNGTITITAEAEDSDGDSLSYSWEADESWLAPLSSFSNMIILINCCPMDAMDSAWVIAMVTDIHGAKDTDSIKIWITP